MAKKSEEMGMAKVKIHGFSNLWIIFSKPTLK